MERHRLMVVVDAATVGGGGDAPLVLATQVARWRRSSDDAAPSSHRPSSHRPSSHRPSSHRLSSHRLSFQALVAEPRQLPLVIVDNDIEGPDRGWELRSPGLWADHVCEQADEHWSYGLEAFALAIDDPAEMLARGYGQPTPLGWELEFEATLPPESTSARSTRQLGLVHGLLLGPGRRLEIEGPAVRGHAWDQPATGVDAGPLLGQSLDLNPVLSDAGRPEAVVDVALPTVDGVWWVARTATGVRTRGT